MAGDEVDLLGVEGAGAFAEDVGREVFRVVDGDGAGGAGFHPPAGERQHGAGGEVEAGHLPNPLCEPFRFVRGLLEAMGVLGPGPDELPPVVEDLVIREALPRAPLAPGLGLDGKEPRGADHDVIEVERPLALIHRHIVKDAVFAGQRVEPFPHRPLAEVAEEVVAAVREVSVNLPPQSHESCRQHKERKDDRQPRVLLSS